MKCEDHLDMPELVVNNVWCEMPPAAAKKYRQFKRELATELESGALFCESQSSAYAKCKQFANGTVYQDVEGEKPISLVAHNEKIATLIELMEMLNGKPLLVFYYYTQDLYRLQEHRLFQNAPAIRGKSKDGKRITLDEINAIVYKWNKGKFPVMFCQWQAGSHGLNMQGACNDVACFGLIDSAEIYNQAFRRVYRQGVKGSQVRIHRLLTRATVDEVMVARLEGKFQTQHDFLEALKMHSKTER